MCISGGLLGIQRLQSFVDDDCQCGGIIAFARIPFRQPNITLLILSWRSLSLFSSVDDSVISKVIGHHLILLSPNKYHCCTALLRNLSSWVRTYLWRKHHSLWQRCWILYLCNVWFGRRRILWSKITCLLSLIRRLCEIYNQSIQTHYTLICNLITRD